MTAQVVSKWANALHPQRKPLTSAMSQGLFYLTDSHQKAIVNPKMVGEGPLTLDHYFLALSLLHTKHFVYAPWVRSSPGVQYLLTSVHSKSPTWSCFYSQPLLSFRPPINSLKNYQS